MFNTYIEDGVAINYNRKLNKGNNSRHSERVNTKNTGRNSFGNYFIIILHDKTLITSLKAALSGVN